MMDRLIDEIELEKERVGRGRIFLLGARSEPELKMIYFRIVAKERGYVVRFGSGHGGVSGDDRDNAVSLCQHHGEPEKWNQVAHFGTRKKSYMRRLCRAHCCIGLL